MGSRYAISFANLTKVVAYGLGIKDYEDFLFFTKVDTLVRKSLKRGLFDWDFSIRNQDFQKFSVF